jgi:hypothetical protein
VVQSDEGSDEADENLMLELQSSIGELPDSLQQSFHIGEPLNGFRSLTASGLRNHYRFEVIEVFRWLAQQGHRSYGLLYVRHDDVVDNKDDFRVFRLAGGKLDDLDDPFLR